MAGKKQRIKDFLLDLTSLEVNTLVTENITGESMGDPRQAIEAIRALYAEKLEAVAAIHAEDSTPSSGPASPPREVSAARAAPGTVAPDSIQGLEQRADELKQQYETRLSKEDQNNLTRIRDRCRELTGLMTKLDGGAELTVSASSQSQRASDKSASAKTAELSPEDTVALRKIWELGMEPIAAQTVIQLSGDVITRLHPKFASGQHPMLLELHRAGTATASEMWSSLVDTAVMILEKIIDR